MIIDCIADLHGYFPKLDGGDVLIVSGDLTARDTDKEHLDFIEWIAYHQMKYDQKYKKVIYIAGNHDHFLYDKDRYGKINTPSHWNIEYLCNSGTEFEGLKIWGTPHSLLFPGVNPRCTAFMGTEEELKEKYDLIPKDIDILISHTPPYGILDKNIEGEHCGSIELRNAMMRVKPKYLVCGHLHECGGKEIDLTMTRVINCSYVNEFYKAVNKSMRIIIDKKN